MFNKFCKLLFLYVVLTFLFSDLSAIKDPGKDFFAQQYEDVSRTAKRFANYVDDTVIPYVDGKFAEADLEKSLAGNLMDKINIPSGQIQKEPFSVEIEEDTFFKEEK
jgi:hypothetical protein